MKLMNDGNRFVLVLTNEEIDTQTFAKIREKYPEGEELKLHRIAIEALIKGENLPEEYVEYQAFVKECISEGKHIKAKQSPLE